MLKTYRELRSPDANTDSASSTEQQSATAQDANTGVSSTPSTPVAKDEDLTAEQIRDKVIAQVSTPKAEDKQESENIQTATSAAVQEESAATTEEQVPFHNHPRWKEVNTELSSLRPLKEEVERLKPLSQTAEQLQQFRATNQIDDQTFADALELAAMFKKNPQAARERLAQVIQNIDLATGAVLPADLQAQVDSGAMPKQYADELARSRMQLQAATQGTKQMQAQSVQQYEQQINGTFAMWDNAKRSIDPDFKPKADVNGPDGKWELVNMRLVAMRNQNPPRNQQEAVALVEKAYAETNAALARFMPKPVQRKNLSSQNSSTAGKPKFQTVREAALAIGRGEKVDPSQINGY